ncbi:hypothetical protein [Qipengyuania sp. NPDC077563]|uniref:hypothetical protein n=1 Tax=Qipengyuania sp. NPDC077563 TaxID=3364497 RepID=UPI00384BE879
MSEKIVFEFNGALADQHQMNFYEAARFQYAAARLLVKLAQFRSTGRFRQKITDVSNLGIILESQSEGSFRINTDAPDPNSRVESQTENAFLNMSLSSLLAYVIERVIEKTNDDDLISLFNAIPEITDRFGRLSPDDSKRLEEIVRLLIVDPELRGTIFPEASELIERRISEVTRQDSLAIASGQVAKIDGPREQKLISMAAPLISEMATALRRSADTLKIHGRSSGTPSNVLYLNQPMAQGILSSKVDDQITPILGNIIQYNKETGWGKVRLGNFEQPLSFSVPSDKNHPYKTCFYRKWEENKFICKYTWLEIEHASQFEL